MDSYILIKVVGGDLGCKSNGRIKIKSKDKGSFFEMRLDSKVTNHKDFFDGSRLFEVYFHSEKNKVLVRCETLKTADGKFFAGNWKETVEFPNDMSEEAIRLYFN
ncbi:hypothetical protein [Metabacillus sp. Hm71]|uniref:hypothetical protein n=1 Tax=Metabacillus sp. Hm71 TaxID=3450743 RepID=UPI003F428690